MTTAPSNNIPISVDYTGRDYYALRQQLIERVQARVVDWKGNDPSDFGLAIIEAFSYMGDMVNYYIDRVANESYILTATQRESLINLAAMYGYIPAGYVSAATTLSMNSRAGFSGQIGGAIIEGGTVSPLSGNFMKLIVPNNHPFTVSPPSVAVISSFSTTAFGIMGGAEVSYNTSVFNGTFPVLYVGYDDFGSNVIWIRPSAGITSIASTSAQDFTVTLTELGRTIDPVVGQKIEIKRAALTSSATAFNYNGKWVIDTVTPSISGSEIIVGVKTDADDTIATITKARVVGSTLVYSAWTSAPSVDFVLDETVTITGIKDSSNSSGTAGVSFNQTEKPITAIQDKVGYVSKAKWTFSSPNWTVEYRLSKPLTAGDYVSFREIKDSTNLTGATDSNYNLSDAIVTTAATETATIENVTGQDVNGSGYILYQTTAAHGFSVGDFVTITGVVNTANTYTDRTDVYNIPEARILAIGGTAGSETTFIVNGYWSNTFDLQAPNAATATLYKARITGATGTWGLNGDPSGWGTPSTANTGGFISRFFKIAKGSASPGTWATPATPETPKAIPQVGGTYDETTSTDEVVYAPLPTLRTSGPTATEYGFTTVPAGSQVSTQVTVGGATKDVIFSTQADVQVPYGKTINGVLAVHGEEISLRTENLASVDGFGGHDDIAGELLGYSTGKADQMFMLKEVQVPTSSVRIFIDTGTSWEEWLQVQYIQDHGPTEKVFQVSVDALENVRVVFGDGISGSIPVSGSGIKTHYISGGGSIGNIAAGSLTTWNSVLGEDAALIRSKISVTNDFDATGGTDPETNDSIRYNAPRALRALNRAVTLQDFADIALSADGIAKTNAVGVTRNSVTIYAAPFSSGVGDNFPGYDASGQTQTVEMVRYLTQIEAIVAAKCQIGTSLTLLPPSYSPVTLEITYSALPAYNAELVGDAIKLEVANTLSFENMSFGEVLTPEEVEFQLRQVEGVSSLKITGMYRYGGSGRTTLVGDPDEIFVFTGTAVTLTQATSGAYLTGLTIRVGSTDYDAASDAAFNPKLGTTVYTYTLSGITAGTIATWRVTPTASTNASVVVNDKAVTGAYVDLGSYTLSSTAPRTVVVTVTAQDGQTTSTYRVRITT